MVNIRSHINYCGNNKLSTPTDIAIRTQITRELSRYTDINIYSNVYNNVALIRLDVTNNLSSFGPNTLL